jgi:hypothetical protein
MIFTAGTAFIPAAPPGARDPSLILYTSVPRAPEGVPRTHKNDYAGRST